MTQPTKNKRGGFRPGSGRKVTIGATVRLTITIDEATHATLKAINSNMSEAVRILAAAHK